METPKPQIIIDPINVGLHNVDPEASRSRIMRGNTYRDCSCVCIHVTRGVIPARVVQSWLHMMAPMNQKFLRIFVTGMEVGQGYSMAVEQILGHPELSKWKYVLTVEEDNLPPPNGLLLLLESIQEHDAVGGLYWTKGEGGQPMIYGRSDEHPRNFIPQMPEPETVQPCNGLGMGFTLFRLDMLKDSKLPRPLFQTRQGFHAGTGESFTQDLFFFNNARAQGYRVACDTRCKVGHYEAERDIVW